MTCPYDLVWVRILRLPEIIMQVFATPSTPFGCKALKKSDIVGVVCPVFAAPLLPLLPLPTVLGGISVIMSGTGHDVVAYAALCRC